MLDILAYLVPLVLASLIGAYLYIEAQKRKAIAAQKKAIIRRVSRVKSNYKNELKKLVEQNIISVNQNEILFRLANNFFVFQPVTERSITFCEQSLNNVISALLNLGPESLHYELVQKEIDVLVRSLPTVANSFNSPFYRETLPKLIKQFLDIKEELYKIESDLSNEETSTDKPFKAA